LPNTEYSPKPQEIASINADYAAYVTIYSSFNVISYCPNRHIHWLVKL
jgi:hypothetical protein